MPEIYPLDLRRSINSCDFPTIPWEVHKPANTFRSGKWPRRWRKPSALLHISKIARSLTRAKSADSDEGGQLFRLKADNVSDRLRTAFG
jgi:hypothetical protein